MVDGYIARRLKASISAGAAGAAVAQAVGAAAS